MKLTEHIAQRLTNLGVDCSVVGDEIHVDRTPRPVKIRISAGFEDSFESYNRARSISFDEPTRVLTHNNSVEFLLTHISIGGLGPMEEYVLSDSKSNSVCVGPATNEFSFAFFDSKAYEDFFDKRVRKRILETNIFNRSVEQILWTPRTARYNHKGKKTPPDLQQKAVVAIKSSLFKISVELHDCWSIWKPRKPRNVSAIYDSPADALSIPPAIYDENVVSYYMVAKASPFPSQSFLAYYHVLEYYFLKVSELGAVDVHRI